MSPLERRILELEKEVQRLREVRDVAFIENLKRLAIGNTITISLANQSASGQTTAVAGADTNDGTGGFIDVAAEFDNTLIIEDGNGNTYRLGYYT